MKTENEIPSRAVALVTVLIEQEGKPTARITFTADKIERWIDQEGLDHHFMIKEGALSAIARDPLRQMIRIEGRAPFVDHP